MLAAVQETATRECRGNAVFGSNPKPVCLRTDADPTLCVPSAASPPLPSLSESPLDALTARCMAPRSIRQRWAVALVRGLTCLTALVRGWASAQASKRVALASSASCAGCGSPGLSRFVKNRATERGCSSPFMFVSIIQVCGCGWGRG